MNAGILSTFTITACLLTSLYLLAGTYIHSADLVKKLKKLLINTFHILLLDGGFDWGRHPCSTGFVTIDGIGIRKTGALYKQNYHVNDKTLDVSNLYIYIYIYIYLMMIEQFYVTYLDHQAKNNVKRQGIHFSF